MTGRCSLLSDVKACNPVAVSLADGSVRTATAMGTVNLVLPPASGATKLQLQGVLLVPDLQVSLFSVRTAARKGYRTLFSDDGFEIVRGSKTVLRGKSTGALYVLPEATGSKGAATEEGSGTAAAAAGSASRGGGATPVPALTLHRRVGHLSPGEMLRMAAVVDGMHVTAAYLDGIRKTPCPPCIVGKMTRSPFLDSTRVTSRPLELVSSDVAGPMAVPSAGGCLYNVSVVDHHTRYKAIVPVRRKGEASTTVITVLNRWAVETRGAPNTVRTDGALDYGDAVWSAWVRDRGIRHERTTRYTPQQNGVAERYNRTVAERVTAMLSDAALPLQWWAEASVTANSLANRTPQRGQAVTPYEAFHGVRPDVAHLRAFGCRAWVSTPGDVRRKNDPRAVEGVFLGYGAEQKGYRVLCGDRVLVSRDVRFDEAAVGANRTPASLPDLLPEPVLAAPIDAAVEEARRLFGGLPSASDAGEGELVDVPAATGTLAPATNGEVPPSAPDAPPEGVPLTIPLQTLDASTPEMAGTDAPSADGAVGSLPSAASGAPPSRHPSRLLRANPRPTVPADAHLGVGSAGRPPGGMCGRGGGAAREGCDPEGVCWA